MHLAHPPSYPDEDRVGQKVKTYAEVLQELDRVANPALLVANGFSQAWDPAVFNYANLLDKADFGERSAVLRGLFHHFETYDFEKVMNHLLSAEAVAKAYDADDAVVKQIAADQQVLKDTLIATLGATHPSRPSDVTTEQFSTARTFRRVAFRIG